MKKLICNLSILLFVNIFYVQISGCTGEKTSNSILVGSWNVTSVEYDAFVGSMTIYDYYKNVLGYSTEEANLTVANFDAKVKAYLESTLIEFESDYWYWTNIADIAGDEGNWSINDNETMIILDEGTQWETTIAVHSLTKNKLEISFTMVDEVDLDDDPITSEVEVTFNLNMTLTK